MLLSRVPTRAVQLRESYIAISNCLRGRCNDSTPKSRRDFACQAGLRSAEHDKISEGSPQDGSPSGTTQHGVSVSKNKKLGLLAHYENIFELPRATCHWDKWDLRPDHITTLHGYVTSMRRASKDIDFVDFVDPQLRQQLQLIVYRAIVGDDVQEQIRNLRPHTPVAVSGSLATKLSLALAGEDDPASSDTRPPRISYHTLKEDNSSIVKAEGPVVSSGMEFRVNPYVGKVQQTTPRLELTVRSIKPLNHFPEDIVAKEDTQFTPQQRHLQLRTSSTLRSSLRARSKAQTECRKYLFMKGFDEMETPILFKSTSEGAREFLVPTRQKGLAYALPQSPQQFKQILMASGISKYFQFAKCFRDEDMRADRQPEFTQLDIEMSFACAEDVMKIAERIIQVLWTTFLRETIFSKSVRFPEEYTMRDIPASAPLYFPRITYRDAMKSWGSDKPDRRLGSKLLQIEAFVDPTLKSKITSLKNPVIDIMRFKVSNPGETRKFIRSFLEGPSAAPYMNNPDGAPGIFIFDPAKPMNGLSALEHEAVEKIIEELRPIRGNLLVMQARSNRPFYGESSTLMGNLRRDLLMELQRQGFYHKPSRHEFLWVTDFPLFSRTDDTDPGQGGKAGIKSTHHPFTAPKTVADLKLLAEHPLDCTADHFDLVINGVEVGGGSRRIHDSKVQEMVLRDVLKVPEKQLEEFRPLLEALRAGCPPHAGIAIGFDRLMAILRDTTSVRDVIAFPKTGNGEDKLTGAPSSISAERWAEYHMAVEP